MLKVEQTLTCDICGGKIRSLTQRVVQGTPMEIIACGPVGMTTWTDVCAECSDPLMQAFRVLKAAKAAG
jgi:hypothetical protein